MSFQQGLSGLNTAAKQLDVIGNNVANASTVGFKQSQAQFADLYAASLAGGSGLAVGTGVKLAAVAQQFSQGNVTNTSNSMDTAISGAGFFQMIDQSGALLYSRNGQFQVNKNGYIVNNQGHQLQGYQATAGVVTAVQGPLRIDPAPLSPKQTSNMASIDGVPIGVGANLDSRAAFPLGITQGTITGTAVPGLTISAAVTAGQYAATIIPGVGLYTGNTTFSVDGFPMTLTSANMDTAVAAQTALQTQLTTLAPGVYTATVVGNAVTIAKVATGSTSTAPVITDPNANATVAGFASGTSTAGVDINNTMTVTVDGITTGTVTIPVATYTTRAALAAAVQTAINADAALVLASKSVTVSVNASGNLVMVSNSGGAGSSIAVANALPSTGTVANLFSTATPTAGAGVFSLSAPDSYNNSTSLTVYDSKGTQHIASLYFQKASSNTWNVYLAIDSASVPAAATPLATLNFSTAGVLTSVTPGPNSTQLPPLTTKMVGSDPAYTPQGANAMPLAFDFSQTTQYGGAFGVPSLTQDGYTSGELSGFSTSTDGTIVGRYTNGQTQALGQIGLVNFTNPQGLQPVGNNEWVETPESGMIPLNRPGSSGLGLLQSSAVEDSNVDLTAELVNMITAQRVYQANAQTIKTQDAVLQTLVNLR